MYTDELDEDSDSHQAVGSRNPFFLDYRPFMDGKPMLNRRESGSKDPGAKLEEHYSWFTPEQRERIRQQMDEMRQGTAEDGELPSPLRVSHWGSIMAMGFVFERVNWSTVRWDWLSPSSIKLLTNRARSSK